MCISLEKHQTINRRSEDYLMTLSPHTASSRPKDRGILILDYGSQYTLLIARRLRELGVYCEIIDGASSSLPANCLKPTGLILSGGPDSVGQAGSRGLPAWVLGLQIPTLGICYGLQLLIEHFGGKIREAKKREYGRAQINLKTDPSKHTQKSIFLDSSLIQTAWMSHGDDCESLPECLVMTASSSSGVIASFQHVTRPVFGLQFHPEVSHTEFGDKILENFAKNICLESLDWKSDSRIKLIGESLAAEVGNDEVLVACSGGVDSTVTAALLAKTIDTKKLHVVLCDTGLMRKNEIPWVSKELKGLGIEKIEVIEAASLFFESLKGVIDPEQKRKIIGRLFIEKFEEYAQKHPQIKCLAQGTLYPDVIESAGHGSGAKVIKSHHNVGGLPEKLKLRLIEPLRWIFKDEVRKIGLELGLPSHLIDRHPFPGPGLAVRIIGEVTKAKADILREADDIFIQLLRKNGLYHKTWQTFAVLLPVKSVGVMGDNRTYQDTVALRSVTSIDGMTADVSHLPMDFLVEVANTIIQQVSGVNRVVYDVTSKPPGTIEWE
jgi:GMP synthase (glutamine-hydrolysing)